MISTPKKTQAAQPKSQGVNSHHVILSVVIVAGVCICVFMLSHREEKTVDVHISSEVQTPKAAKEWAKHTVPTKIRPIPAQKHDEPPFWEIDASQTNKLTRMQLRKWEIMHRPKRELSNVVWKKDRYAIFDHKSENMIASLITAKPGQGFIGTPNYRGITEDFIESCKHPIIITKEDDEYSANLKRDMIAVKIDIMNRLKDGEDFVSILQDARKELQELASYKQIIESEFKKLAISSATAEEINDALNAANILLEKKGIAPIKGGPITRIRLKHFNDGGYDK